MELLTTAALYLGYALAVAGLLGVWLTSIVFIWKASRESALWGLACALIPIAGFVFALRFWKDVRGVVLTHFTFAGILIAGLGLVLVDAEKRAFVVEAVKERDTLLEEMDKPKEQRTNRKQREAKQALAQLTEKRQKAAELYGFIQTWRTELLERQPDENASEEQKKAFQTESTNYQGLLEEYKTLAAEIKQTSQPPAPVAVAATPAPTPEK